MEWRQIPNCPNYYCSSEGVIKNFKTGNILSVTRRKNDYPVVRLYDSNSRRKMGIVHRIYGLLFKENPKNLPFINHINGNKDDYTLNNLEWVTHSENIKHAFRIGLSKGNKLLDRIQVLTIGRCISDGMRNKELSEYFRVHNSVISNIRTGNTYSCWQN